MLETRGAVAAARGVRQGQHRHEPAGRSRRRRRATCAERLSSSPSVAALRLMMHFARADEDDGLEGAARGVRGGVQGAAVSALARQFRGRHPLCAKSAATSCGRASCCTARRRFRTTRAEMLGLQPVMTLRSQLIAVQDARRPTRASATAATYTASRAHRIGVVACGYADGYPRHAPNGTPVLVCGKKVRHRRPRVDGHDHRRPHRRARGARRQPGRAVGRRAAGRRRRERRVDRRLRAAVRGRAARAARRRARSARSTSSCERQAIQRCTSSSPAPPASSARTSCAALNARGETRHHRGRQPRATPTSSATSPTARSPTTSTRTNSSRGLSAGDFDDDVARDPAPGRVLRHDGDRRPLHDAQQLPLLGRRCSTIARTTTFRSSTRRARRCTARGTTFREEREHEAPLNVYGYSKFLFDQYVRRMLPERTAQIAGFRYFNVYGPREQHKGRMASVALSLLQPVSRRRHACGCSKARAATPPASSGATSSRVDDVVAANLDFLDHPERSGIFNLGTGPRGRRFNEVAAADDQRVPRGRRRAAADARRARARRARSSTSPFPPRSPASTRASRRRT